MSDEKKLIDEHKLDNKVHKNNFVNFFVWLNIFLWFLLYINYFDKVNHFIVSKFSFLYHQQNENVLLSAEEITAYHEAGHATIVLMFLNDFNIKKATIKPSKNALGYVAYDNLKHKITISRILVILGGAAAQKILCEEQKISKKDQFKGCGHDFYQLQKFLQTIYKKKLSWDMIKNKYFNLYLNQVEKIISENKILFNNIAQSLLNKKTLYKKELIELMKKNKK